MQVKHIIEEIEFRNRVISIHERNNLTVYDGEYDIRTIEPNILNKEVNTYITKIEDGVMYLDIYI